MRRHWYDGAGFAVAATAKISGCGAPAASRSSAGGWVASTGACRAAPPPTVAVKVRVTVPPLVSLAVTVISAVPGWPAARVKVVPVTVAATTAGLLLATVNATTAGPLPPG